MAGRTIRFNGLLCAAHLALMLAAGPLRAADEVHFGKGATFQAYGQLSPAWLSFDDGKDRKRVFADNDNSISRLGFWVRQPVGDGEIRFNFESALGFRSTNAVSQIFVPPVWDWQDSDIRKLELVWQTHRFGTFSAGQGNMATDGVSTVDLSDTSVVSSVQIIDTAGSFFLRSESGFLTPVAVASAFPNFDGGRRMRLRYDSPSFRGLVLSTSLGKQVLSQVSDDMTSDITVRYDRDGRYFQISAAGGYSWINRKTFDNNRTAIASASVIHKPSGLNLTVSSGTRDTTGSYRYVKLSYRADILRIGATTVSIDRYEATDMITDGARSESYGLSFIQRLANPRIEAYLAVRSYAYEDLTPLRYRDARSVLIGVRWKF